MMTETRFRELLDAYGADPRRWPADERGAAEAFSASAQAQTSLAEARQLDAALEAFASPGPSFELRQAVLAAAPRGRSSPFSRVRPFGLWSGAGWAAAAAAGVVLGVSLGQQLVRDWEAAGALEQASAWSLDEAEYLG